MEMSNRIDNKTYVHESSRCGVVDGKRAYNNKCYNWYEPLKIATVMTLVLFSADSSSNINMEIDDLCSYVFVFLFNAIYVWYDTETWCVIQKNNKKW